MNHTATLSVLALDGNDQLWSINHRRKKVNVSLLYISMSAYLKDYKVDENADIYRIFTFMDKLMAERPGKFISI